MFTTLIFSKDRPMQLDATLRSFFLHCLDPKTTQVHVLYKATSTRLASQYDVVLKRDYPQVRFHAQENFRRDTFTILDPFQGRSAVFHALTLTGAVGFRIASRPDLWLRHFIDAPRLALVRRLFPKLEAHSAILFLVDDNIFIRSFHLAEALVTLEREKKAIGFALKLGINITYCYPLDIPLKFPMYQPIAGEIIKYRWPNAGNGLNYPLEVSSSIYRLGNVAQLLAGLNFSNPNMLEGQMANKSADYRVSHPYLLCYKHSVTFCNPVNKVQNVYDNKAGRRTEHSADFLAALFDEGYRINIFSYQDFIPSACHQEVVIHFEKPEAP